MRNSTWAVIIGLLGILLVVLLLGFGVLILFGTPGGMMTSGTTFGHMMGRLCPSCGQGYGLLGGLAAVVMMGLMLLLPLALLILITLGIVWLVRRLSGGNNPRPAA